MKRVSRKSLFWSGWIAEQIGSVRVRRAVENPENEK